MVRSRLWSAACRRLTRPSLQAFFSGCAFRREMAGGRELTPPTHAVVVARRGIPPREGRCGPKQAFSAYQLSRPAAAPPKQAIPHGFLIGELAF